MCHTLHNFTSITLPHSIPQDITCLQDIFTRRTSGQCGGNFRTVILRCVIPRCVGSITKNIVYYTYSRTQLYFTQQYNRNTTTCFGPIRAAIQDVWGVLLNFIDATYYFIVLLISWTCFGHYYAHHQEFATITKNIVYYTYSRTQLYFSQHYSRNTTTRFGPTCGPSSGWDFTYRAAIQDMWGVLLNFIDATYYFIVLLISWTCFGHYYAHHQELAIITKNIMYYTYSRIQLYFTQQYSRNTTACFGPMFVGHLQVVI